MELWEKFGSRSEYLHAPRRLTDRVRLILYARHTVENELEQENRSKQEKAEREMAMQRAQQGMRA
jgi:hypothetical protein